jgi:hypothetical protein
LADRTQFRKASSLGRSAPIGVLACPSTGERVKQRREKQISLSAGGHFKRRTFGPIASVPLFFGRNYGRRDHDH